MRQGACFAISVWITLSLLQGIFIVARAVGVIFWKWYVIMVPLWIFLLLPILSMLYLKWYNSTKSPTQKVADLLGRYEEALRDPTHKGL